MDRRRIERNGALRKVVILQEVDSTNDAAKRALKENEATPFLIVAKRQTQGRGSSGRVWVDWDGALLFSLGARWSDLGFSRDESAAAALAVGAAVAETARETIARELGVPRSDALDARTVVKPPNDVLFDGRKMSGVLIESPNVETVVVGIGVNFANEARDAPELLERGRSNSIVEAMRAIDPERAERARARADEIEERFLSELIARLLKV